MSIIMRFMRSPIRTIREEKTLVKFLLVGASGAVLNEIILITLLPVIGKIFAQAVGVELSIINNFVWNDSFTFKNVRRGLTGKGRSRLFRLLKYNALSLGTFALNLAIYVPLVTFVWKEGILVVASSIAAILVAFVFNYLGSSRWAWKATEQVDNPSRTRSSIKN